MPSDSHSYKSAKYGNILRTPDSAFSDRPDYPFEPHYVEVDGLRMHYVDEGSENQNSIFLLHGQPSWSYLYRKMIPLFVGAGYRVIAPDLIGFGRSDKPVSLDAISYQTQVNWMKEFVQKLGIKNADAFMQDWGGMIGLRVLAEEPDWISRLVVSNTALSDATRFTKFLLPRILKAMRFFAGKATIKALVKKQSYGNWASYFHHTKTLEIGKIMQILTVTNLSDTEMAAYDAPFSDERYFAAPRAMPQIVGTQLNEAEAA